MTARWKQFELSSIRADSKTATCLPPDEELSKALRFKSQRRALRDALCFMEECGDLARGRAGALSRHSHRVKVGLGIEILTINTALRISRNIACLA